MKQSTTVALVLAAGRPTLTKLMDVVVPSISHRMVLIEVVAGTIFLSFFLLFKIRAADTHFNLFYSFGWFLINFFTFPVFFFNF